MIYDQNSFNIDDCGLAGSDFCVKLSIKKRYN